MRLIAEGVSHGGYGDGKGGWVSGVLESVQLERGEGQTKDVSHVLEKGKRGKEKKNGGNGY